MIESATSCLKRGGKPISAITSKFKKTQRSLHSSFWTHGAGDIELPPWWNNHLQHPAATQLPTGDTSSQVSNVLHSNFLDFLYPPKTIQYAQKLAHQRIHNNTTTQRRSVTVGRRNGRLRGHTYATTSQEKADPDILDLDAALRQVEESEIQPDWIQKQLGESNGQAIHENQEKPNKRRAEVQQQNGHDINWNLRLATAASESASSSKSSDNPTQRSNYQEDIDSHFNSILAGAAVEAKGTDLRSSVGTPAVGNTPGNDFVHHSTVEQVIENAIADSKDPHVAATASRIVLLDFWNKQSKQLGEAFGAYLDSLAKTRAIPQSENDFISTFNYEVPLIEWQMESTFDAGITFLKLLIDHLQSKVFPTDRGQWTENQWAFFIGTILHFPKKAAVTRQRTGLKETSFPTGQRGIFNLLHEALAYGKATTSIRELLGLAIARRQVDFANSLLIFCRKKKFSIDQILSGLDNVDPPLLARWIVGLIERIEIPRWLKTRQDLHTKLQPDRQSYLDLIYLMVEYLLKRPLSLDMNVASYEKAWVVFLKYESLSSMHFVLALDQLIEVESNDSADLAAFVSLAYKLFNAASQRSDFVWSEPKVQAFLRKMTATRHSCCWEVFQYYQKTFGYNCDVSKIILMELSYAGEAERWQEVFEELSSKEDIDKVAWFHQLLIAYSKRANIAACRTLLDSIEKDLGRFPDLASWNAVLHAYVQADDIDGALKFREYMKTKGVQQDVSTSMILLRGYASRGEPVQASDQLAQIRAEGHALTGKMIYHLVFAYLNNEDMDSAEQLLYDTIDTPTEDPKTDAWNAVLTTYAHQGKIADMNYVHSLMYQHGIKDDEKTYAALMLGFANSDNVLLAVNLISNVMPMHNMVPTIRHYNILLDVLVRKKQYTFALQLYQSLKKQHLKPDVVTHNLAVRAISSIHGRITAGKAGWHRVQGRALAQAEEFLRQTLEADSPGHIVSNSPLTGRDGQPIDQAFASLRFTSLLMREGKTWNEEQMNSFIKKYQAFYREKYPDQQVVMPVKMLTVIAEHYMAMENYDGIIRLWQQALDTISPFAARADADTSKPNWVLPSRSTLLGPIFRLYMIVLMKRKQDVELSQTIKDLTEAGWRFSSAMWNTYVTYLAQNGELYLALKTCEEYLIEGFSGWPRSMRSGQSPRKDLSKKPHGSLRWQQKKPTYETLVWLTYAYAVWRKKYAFSVHRAELLAELWDVAPRTLNTVTYMPRVYDLEQNLILRDPHWRKRKVD